MIRIQLPEAEVDRLEQVLRTTDDRKLRDRLQIVLTGPPGPARTRTSPPTWASTGTVQRWLNAYLERRPRRPAPRKAKGAAPKIPADLADEVRRWVIDGPAKQGLDRANWTHEELADHLLQDQRHPDQPQSAMQRVLPQASASGPTGPTYRYLRGDPDKQAQAKEDLADLKKGRRRASSSC